MPDVELPTDQELVLAVYPNASLIVADREEGTCEVVDPQRGVLGVGSYPASAWRHAAEGLPDMIATDKDGRRLEFRHKLYHELRRDHLPQEALDIYGTAHAYATAILDSAMNSPSDAELFGPLVVTGVPKGPSTFPPKPRIAFTAEQARNLGGPFGRQKRKP